MKAHFGKQSLELLRSQPRVLGIQLSFVAPSSPEPRVPVARCLHAVVCVAMLLIAPAARWHRAVPMSCSCLLVLMSPQIVTAELKAESNRDVVIYKIRVGDDTGEWTVSRRFRNFETLHRALRYTFLLC